MNPRYLTWVLITAHLNTWRRPSFSCMTNEANEASFSCTKRPSIRKKVKFMINSPSFWELSEQSPEELSQMTPPGRRLKSLSFCQGISRLCEKSGAPFTIGWKIYFEQPANNRRFTSTVVIILPTQTRHYFKGKSCKIAVEFEISWIFQNGKLNQHSHISWYFLWPEFAIRFRLQKP